MKINAHLFNQLKTMFGGCSEQAPRSSKQLRFAPQLPDYFKFYEKSMNIYERPKNIKYRTYIKPFQTLKNLTPGCPKLDFGAILDPPHPPGAGRVKLDQTKPETKLNQTPPP
jgi:hypothetical protein